jgi:hypothetical protein
LRFLFPDTTGAWAAMRGLRHRSGGHALAKLGDHDSIEEAGHRWTKLADGFGEMTKASVRRASVNKGRFSRTVQ